MVSMEEEACRLEVENMRLRQRVAELESITQLMKKTLVDAIKNSP